MDDLTIRFRRYDSMAPENEGVESATVARNVATMTPAGVLIPLDEQYHLIPWGRVIEITSADDFGNILFV